ncbi:MAG: ribosome maturation factor RimP [Eubacteriales bacterium]
MSKKEVYETQTEQYLEDIIKDTDLEVYDVEYVKEGSEWYLRVYLDKEDGVDIQDCEFVSRAMSEILDAKDYIEDAYIFEVSSPGLGRTLKKEKHFEKNIGQEIEIKLYKSINKQKEFVGILKKFDKDTLVITVQQDGQEIDQTIARTDIAVVKLTFDF